MFKIFFVAVLVKAARKFGRDKGTDIAATMTYYAVLALFPGLVATISLLSLIVQGMHVADVVLTTFQQIAPPAIVEVLRDPLIAVTHTPAAGFGFVLGLGGALWSASSYTAAFSRGMNRVYKIDEGRSYIRVQLTMLVVTVINMMLLILMAIIFVLMGPLFMWLGDMVGIGQPIFFVWNILKWPLVLLLAIIIVAVLYNWTPNVHTKFRVITVGSVFAIIVWMLATGGVFFYISNFSNYNAIYGSLGGVIAFLLWVYITNLVLIFGAELDTEITHVHRVSVRH
jgi:membrane protein